MILIVMTARSGSSLVAKIFAAHGWDTGGEKVYSAGYETYENAAVNRWIDKNKHRMIKTTGTPCQYIAGVEKHVPENAVVKTALEYAGVFEKLDPMLITVKRDPHSVARSLATKRGKPEEAKDALNGIKMRYRGMDRLRKAWNGAEVNTDELIAGDMTSISMAFKHHGLYFDDGIARKCIDPKLWHKWQRL